jgi:hypothetical protein
LTGVDTPGAKPFVPTGALGSVPSEEVTPSGGMSVPTWANAGPQHNRGKVAAAIKKDLMEHFSDNSGRTTKRADAGTAVSKAAGQRLSFSWPLSLTDKNCFSGPRSDRRPMVRVVPLVRLGSLVIHLPNVVGVNVDPLALVVGEGGARVFPE